MDEPRGHSVCLVRGLRQMLESLQRAGVEQLPRAGTAKPLSDTGKAKLPLNRSTGHGLSTTAPLSDEPALPMLSTPSASQRAGHVSAEESSPRIQEEPMVGRKSPRPVSEGREVPYAASARPRQQQLAQLCEEVKSCQRCPQLVAQRTQTVFGVGNPHTRLCFFGEAPGADEDRLGEPFVGRAGQLLDKIIEACTLKRRDVYILNTVKCRPPGNRNPDPEEVANCRPFFEKQLEIIRPDFICCLGLVSATALLDTKLSVGKLRGQLHSWRWAQVLVTYHPAYLLRNPDAKKLVWDDMKLLMNAMDIRLASTPQ